ncbi:hypothetical protein CGRA01v4_05659 [Colletotrichum graminicola]|nr:hypothetical protein CGRA01v4_05659 [Colletotrichum graminicola]
MPETNVLFLVSQCVAARLIKGFKNWTFSRKGRQFYLLAIYTQIMSCLQLHIQPWFPLHLTPFYSENADINISYFTSLLSSLGPWDLCWYLSRPRQSEVGIISQSFRYTRAHTNV